MDCTTSSPCISSCASDWLDWDGSSMLSTLSNFLRSFGRGVECANASSCGSSRCSLTTSCVWRGGAKTKRFAGVTFLNCSSGFGCMFFTDAGVCIARTLRRPDVGFLVFCMEGGLGARKRCGEGVWVGIVRATSAIAACSIWRVGGVRRNLLCADAWSWWRAWRCPGQARPAQARSSRENAEARGQQVAAYNNVTCVPPSHMYALDVYVRKVYITY
jgi:hypothetical protein